ncbi:MAG: DUF2057 family protein [Gammaproteobacteria bacterium]
MKYRAILLLFLSASLMACSATGPVRFYSGPQKPKNELAIITVPAALTVDSIDGKPVDAPSKESGTYEVQLEPGFHLIDFRYVLYWGSLDSGMLVKSKPTGVDTVFKAGHHYTIRYKKPEDASQAQDFLTDFNAQLVDLDTGETHDSYVVSDVNAALAKARATHETQKPANSHAASAETQTAMPDAKTATTGNPVKHLKFWWLMANPQQRKQFMDWMKSASESFAPGADTGTTTAPADKTPPPAADTINGVKLKP